MLTRDALQCRAGGVLLPPRLFGSTAYYAAVGAFEHADMDFGMRFNKRDKAAHRYAIADVHGRLDLTVPIVKPMGCATAAGIRWHDITVSTHGRWWDVHRTALESAYGRTPYFEHYIPLFNDFLAPRQPSEPQSVAGLCMSADAIVRHILGLPQPGQNGPESCCRYELPHTELPPYWQVRADKLGFISDLSILDLLFNLGPEAASYLLEAQKTLGLR